MLNVVVHSFRHSFHDRLINADVQSEMINRFGDRLKQYISQGNDDGYSIRQKLYSLRGKSEVIITLKGQVPSL